MRKLFLGLLGLLAWTASALAVVPTTRVGNAAYTITNTDTVVVTSVAFSAARTWTLPSAAGTCIGQTCPQQQLQIIDTLGTITSTNTLTIAPVSGNTINGNAANLILSAAGVRVVLVPTSGTNWQATVIGDFRSSSVVAGSAVALTTNTPANVTSISLSQGQWSCTGNVARTTAATTSVTYMSQSISAVSATAGDLGTTMTAWATAANVVVGDPSFNAPTVRLSLAATTTYYLVVNDIFTVDTNAAFGSITCQRL